MASERMKIDRNYKGVSAAVTNDADQEIRMLRVNTSTGRLLCDVIISSGFSAQTAILNGQIYDALEDSGAMAMGGDGTNYRILKTDADGHLQVDILSGAAAAEQYADNVAVNAAYKGNLVLGTDGSNYQVLSVNSAGRLQVDVFSALPAGDANIGNIDIVSFPAGNLGMQTMAASISIVPASNITDATYIGDIKFGEALPAGTANIGDVDVLTIAAGDNNIGNVDIVTVPADPFGLNADAVVAAGAAGSISAKLRAISRDIVANIVLAAGANAIGKLAANSGVDIGDVDILSIAAGNNNIGDVDIASVAAGDNNIGNVDIVTMPGVVGTIADDATTPGAPVMVGGKAVETDGTDPGSVSAEDDVAIFRTDRNRRLLVNTVHPNLWTVADTETSAQTDKELKAAPAAGLSLYITDIIVSNGATAGTVLFEEATAGAKTVKVAKLYLAVNGGAVINFRTPLRVTAATNFGFTSATVTTHTITIMGYTAP